MFRLKDPWFFSYVSGNYIFGPISSIQTPDYLIKQGSGRQWWVGKIQIWSSPYFPPNLIPSVKCTPNRSPSHVWRRAAWSSTFVHSYLHTFPWGQDVKFTPTPVFSNLTQFSFREDKFSVLCNKIWIAGKKNQLDFKSREMTHTSHFPISWWRLETFALFGSSWVGRLGNLCAELSLISKVTLGATSENRLFIFFLRQFGHFQLQ